MSIIENLSYASQIPVQIKTEIHETTMSFRLMLSENVRLPLIVISLHAVKTTKQTSSFPKTMTLDFLAYQ